MNRREETVLTGHGGRDFPPIRRQRAHGIRCPEEMILWSGEPTWSGDTAPPRRKRRRTAEWDDDMGMDTSVPTDYEELYWEARDAEKEARRAVARADYKARQMMRLMSPESRDACRAAQQSARAAIERYRNLATRLGREERLYVGFGDAWYGTRWVDGEG